MAETMDFANEMGEKPKSMDAQKQSSNINR